MDNKLFVTTRRGLVRDLPQQQATPDALATRLRNGERVFALSANADGGLVVEEVEATAAAAPVKENFAVSVGGVAVGVASLDPLPVKEEAKAEEAAVRSEN